MSDLSHFPKERRGKQKDLEEINRQVSPVQGQQTVEVILLLAVLLAAIVVAVALIFGSRQLKISETTDSNEIQTPSLIREQTLETEMFDLINNLRETNGLNPLRVDPVLSRVALFRSEDMAKQNYFSHEPPSGCNYVCVLDYVQSTHAWAGENIAWNTYSQEETVKTAMDMLIASPSHYENLVNCHYARIGVGAVKTEGKYYYTQIFEGDIDC